MDSQSKEKEFEKNAECTTLSESAHTKTRAFHCGSFIFKAKRSLLPIVTFYPKKKKKKKNKKKKKKYLQFFCFKIRGGVTGKPKI